MEKTYEQLKAENERLKDLLGECLNGKEPDSAKKREKTFLKELELEQVVTTISTRFVHVEEKKVDEEIDRALSEIGIHAGIDRSYLFLYNQEKQEMSNTHEWCAEGISKEIDNLKNLPQSLFPWWNHKLANNETIYLKTLDDLPPEAPQERAILEPQKVKSLLVVPVFNSGKTIGFMGFDAVRDYKSWTESNIRMLRLVAEILGSTYKKLDLNRTIRRYNEELEALVEKRTRENKEISLLNNAIIRTTGAIIFSVGKDGTILTMNPVAERLLGYQAEEVVTIKKTKDFYFQEDLNVLREEWEKEFGLHFETATELLSYLARNISHPIEFQLKTKSGKPLPVLLSISAIYDEKGEAKQYAGVATDLSSKKEAEKALQLQKAAFENFVYALIITDVTGKIVWANQSYSDLTGYSLKEIIGCKAGDLQRSGKQNNDFYKTMWQKCLKGKVWKGELINRKKDGTLYPEEMTTTPIKNEKGEIIHFVTIKIDLTERKKAEQRQRESNEINNLLLNTVPDLLFRIDKNGTYLNIFTSDEKKLLAPKENFLGKTINETLPPELAGKSMNMLQQALRIPNEVIKYEYELMLGNNENFFENRLIALSENEVLSIIRDITEQKKAERNNQLQRDLGFALTTTSTPGEALEKALYFVRRAREIKGAGIYLINPETGYLELRKSSGLSKNFIDNTLTYSKNTPQYQIVQKGEPLYGKYENLLKPSSLLREEGINQLGVIPVTYDNRIIGCLNVGLILEHEPDQHTKTFLETTAAQLGGALSRIDTQKDLLLSEKNFQLMFETIDDFMFILDKEGKIIKTNPVVEERLGYTAEELQGMNVIDVHPPKRRKEAGFIVGEMLAGRMEVCPVPLYTKNGGQIPVETKVVPGKWDRKEALYGLSRDITERLKAEEDLRRSEARWQFALESSGDGIWDWQVKTGKVFFSSQWKKMLGYQDSEIGNTLEEWKKRVHPDDLEKVLKALSKHFNGETSLYNNEHRVLCKDGSYKWILDRGKAISRDKNGRPERIVGTHTDISQRKNYEESMAHALEKEKELNELKSQFVSMTSHELRTPLATLLMAAETLESYRDKMSEKEISVKISRIKNNIQFLKSIIDKTMSLSRLETGKLKFIPDKTELNTFLVNIIQLTRNQENNRHKFVFEKTREPLYCKIDKQMMEQVMGNLISNSIKYSKPGTTIKINLDAHSSPDTVFIRVTDQGIGIPENEKKIIFQAFQRGSNAENIRGTGLGLALSREFVRRHAGDITFQSQLNQGTTFCVSLPAIKK